MFQNRFDELYLTICKQVGGIEGLLKSFFDFMIRKTDFFYECDPGDKMGFPPGYNKKLLLGIFQQFQQQHYKRFPKKSPQQFNKKLQAFKQKQQQKKNSPVIEKKQNPPKQKSQEHTAPKKVEQKPQITQKQVKTQQTKQKPQKVESNSTNIDLINTYNGGKNQKYSWSQQIRQVQVTLQIDPQIRAKELKVKIDTKHISVKDKNGNVIIEGELYQKIDSSESVWKIQTIKGKNYLNFNLEKAQQKIWNTVFVGDPQIDTTKVNNSKKLQEFDEQTQGAIRKIMYEQQRKMQGLPTTDQEKQYEALKQAWNAEGSPFKGTPFDPSKLNLAGFQP